MLQVNLLQSFAVSGATGEGVEALAQFVLDEARGRNVYVVGCVREANQSPSKFHTCAAKHTLVSKLGLSPASVPRGAGKVAEIRGHQHHDVFWDPRRASCDFLPQRPSSA